VYWHSLTLLAQSDRFSDLGARFQQSGHAPTWLPLLLAGLTVAAAIAIWFVARYVGLLDRYRRRSQRRLFRELCRLHQLDWPSRRLLRQLALAQGVASPAQLFLQPEKLDSQHLCPTLIPLAGQIDDLRGRLFGDN
jgi:hypothetical protein